MGASDGTVLGLTKIVDSGLPSRRWNLVIVAEGYTATEQDQFHSDAQDLVDELFATAPFDEDDIACAINVYRLDVESDESGADDPACGGAGTGSTADTYFDATFCADGSTRRLLYGNGTLVQNTVEGELPEWHQIAVVVNASNRGGAGGTIAWSSTGSADWKGVFIHELGHAAFGLADEYCYDNGDVYRGGEPSQPNVTAEPDPTAVKWSGEVTAGPDSPTMENSDCSTRNTDPSPVPAGTVGTFEGAYYYHCDVYRPQYSCMMRSTGDEFCAVCLAEIRDFYTPYALPAADGDVRLTSEPVRFNDVPEGVTTHRAATFSVDSCVPITFKSVDKPAPPFGLETPTTYMPDATLPPPWKVRIWFRYGCDSAGETHRDEATIRCVETGEEFTVDLVGECVPRPDVAVQLVFDQSESMLDVTDEGRTKEQVLRDSAQAFTDLLLDENGVGLNAYDHEPHPILDVQKAGAMGAGKGRDDVLDEIESFSANPRGLTAIGDGIELAKDKLDDATAYSEHAMVVLTDGIETAEKRIKDVEDSVINQYVFAIGLGTASQIRPAALDRLTTGTDGNLLMTGNLSEEDQFLLSKFYLQILAGVNNNDIVRDPEGVLGPTSRDRIPFDVTASDIEIMAAVLVEHPRALTMALETPDGDVIGPSDARSDPAVEYRTGTKTVSIRTSLPLVVDGTPAHQGEWHMLLALDETAGRTDIASHTVDTEFAEGVPYSANVHAYSNLNFDTSVSQKSYKPGTPLTITARLVEFGVPFEGRAKVTAELTEPAGTVTDLVLDERETGVFESSITADDPGVYRFRTVANGTTTREQRFTREEISTAPVWMGGLDVDPYPREDDDDLCRLLECLLDSEAVGSETRERLDEYGIDLDALHQCLCQDEQEPRGEDVPARNLGVIQDQLAEILARVSQDK